MKGILIVFTVSKGNTVKKILHFDEYNKVPEELAKEHALEVES